MLTGTSNKKRVDIAYWYKEKWGTSIKDDLEKTLSQLDSSHFKLAVLGMVDTNAELCARFSFKQEGSCVTMCPDVVIPFLCSCTTTELSVYKNCLKTFHNIDVSRGNNSSHFSPLLTKMLNAIRPKDQSVKSDDLTPEFSVKQFVDRLASWNFDDLKSMFTEYKTCAGEDIEETLDKKPYCEFTEHLKQVVKSIREHYEYNWLKMNKCEAAAFQTSLIYSVISGKQKDKIGDYIRQVFPYDASLCHLLTSLCKDSETGPPE